MKLSAVERRLELLKLEGNGFNRSEIVKHLSEKFQVSERTVYYDFEKRGEWQLSIMQVQNPERALMKILNRYEQIYRHAGFKFLQASHDNIKLGALKIMLEANSKILETSVLGEVVSRLKTLEEQSKRGVFIK